MNLAVAYAEAVATPSDINEHLQTLRDLVVEIDAKKVIELGVGITAPSTIAWLAGLEQTGGHLWSVDVLEQPFPDMAGWTFLQGDDLSPDIFMRLPADADIVFIDTLHTFIQTTTELAVYGPRVRPGGRIVCHDTLLTGRWEAEGEYPVQRAVVNFCNLHGYGWQHHAYNYGLAVIDIP